MAIIGLGTDIVEIERISLQIKKHGDRLAKRVLTDVEFSQYQASSYPERFLAKRFAAKEAASKALGTGIAQGVSFQDFQISNNQFGAPILTFTNKALAFFNARDGQSSNISISDERHYAMATVILESE